MTAVLMIFRWEEDFHKLKIDVISNHYLKKLCSNSKKGRYAILNFSDSSKQLKYWPSSSESDCEGRRMKLSVHNILLNFGTTLKYTALARIDKYYKGSTFRQKDAEKVKPSRLFRVLKTGEL